MPGVKGRSGGARRGAGRPKGVPNKVSLTKTAELRKEAKGKDLPLDFMLKMLRGEPIKWKDADGKQQTYHPTVEDRKWAAQQAGPYCHNRLAAIEHSGPAGGPMEHRHTLAPEVLEAIDKIVSRASG